LTGLFRYPQKCIKVCHPGAKAAGIVMTANGRFKCKNGHDDKPIGALTAIAAGRFYRVTDTAAAADV
jgi:hypothetical protein